MGERGWLAVYSLPDWHRSSHSAPAQSDATIDARCGDGLRQRDYEIGIVVGRILL
jgi:hypothetical protein